MKGIVIRVLFALLLAVAVRCDAGADKVSIRDRVSTSLRGGNGAGCLPTGTVCVWLLDDCCNACCSGGCQDASGNTFLYACT